MLSLLVNRRFIVFQALSFPDAQVCAGRGVGCKCLGFQRFGDFYGVYNRVYILYIYIYVSLQTASVIRNMMNYDVVCFAAYCQTNPCGWIMDMHLDVQCFFPRVWCNDLPTGSANHQVDLDDFTIRVMGIITVCLSPWNFWLNVSNDFFFWVRGHILQLPRALQTWMWLSWI